MTTRLIRVFARPFELSLLLALSCSGGADLSRGRGTGEHSDASVAHDPMSPAPDASPQPGESEMPADDAGSIDIDSGTADPDAGAPPPSACVVTICMAGAVTREDGGNPSLGAICEQLPGIIHECSSGTCYPMFSMFQSSEALEALIGALDVNKDGAVDDADGPCLVSIVGYSWGGSNTIDVSTNFAADARVSASRSFLDRVVIIDPYSPLAAVPLVVAKGVVRLWEYRHSIAPASDCSGGAPLGPYLGIPPACSGSSRCVDYDYSLDPDRTFTGAAGPILGADVDHCGIVDASAPHVLRNVIDGEDDDSATLPDLASP